MNGWSKTGNFSVGSSMIGNAGLGHEITIRICKAISAGDIDPANIELREDEYQQALDVLR